jgi:hypothetical protein
MSWDRAKAAAALANVLAGAEPAATAFAEPPYTLNPPAYIVGLPPIVTYASAAFAVDEAELPVICVAADGAFDTVDTLKAAAVGAVAADPTLAGTVQVAWPAEERNWRRITAGGAQMSAVDLIIRIHM